MLKNMSYVIVNNFLFIKTSKVTTFGLVLYASSPHLVRDMNAFSFIF